MKDKILFWIDSSLTEFCIAKFLQEKHDYNLFAIIDTNTAKKFFSNQKIVNFKKVWYYRNYVLNTDKKPDLKYLSSFEKHYSINLWNIVYSDVIFNQHNEYYKFNYDEILSIFEQECKFFESVLDEIKPDFLVIKVTDSSNIQLLQQICKARGIRILTLGFTRLGRRANISADLDTLDNFSKSVENRSADNNKAIEELQKHVKRYAMQQSTFRTEFRASKIQWLKAGLRYLSLICNPNYRNYYVHYGRTITRAIYNEVSFSLKRRYREFFINRNLIKQIDKSVPFVYFPLQLEPERTILIPALFYSNQLEVITNIAKALPVEYKLYVKEHPMQKVRGWRNISYYKEILDLPNVQLIHPSVSNDEMVRNCSLVITITGTSGLEAAFHEKPSIVFADVIYSSLPSVYRLKSLEELPQAIRESLQKEVNPSDLNKFVNLIEKNSFEFDDVEFSIRTCNSFYYGGFLFDVDIPISKMGSFLEENRAIFEKVALEHIKKINQYKYESKSQQKISTEVQQTASAKSTMVDDP